MADKKPTSDPKPPTEEESREACAKEIHEALEKHGFALVLGQPTVEPVGRDWGKIMISYGDWGLAKR